MKSIPTVRVIIVAAFLRAADGRNVSQRRDGSDASRGASLPYPTHGPLAAGKVRPFIIVPRRFFADLPSAVRNALIAHEPPIRLVAMCSGTSLPSLSAECFSSNPWILWLAGSCK